MIKTKKAMTLIEVVVAIGLFGIVMVTIFPAALVLTLMNRVSYENIDTTFIAQQTMERIIFEANTKDITTIHQIVQNEMDFSFNDTGSTTSYNYVNTETNYTVNLTILQDSDIPMLWHVIVVVDSSLNDAEGTRTQMETIVAIKSS